MPWARASELERVMACPAAGHLPRLELVSMSDAADWGTSTHQWKETGKPWDQYAKVFERRERALAAAGVTRESLWPADGLHEVVYALNAGVHADTTEGVVIESMQGTLAERDAWKAEHDDRWVVGTADYVGEVMGQPWVDDLKTGREVPEDPAELVQLRFYGTVLLLSRQVDEVLLSITHWPRYPADGVPTRYWGTWNWELAGWFLEELKGARRALMNSKARKHPDARPGAHCLYCPAKERCPELY